MQCGLLIALFERVMLAECPDYKNYKKNKAKVKTQSNVEEWDRSSGLPPADPMSSKSASCL